MFEYKLYQLNLGKMARRINENFEKNGGYDEIRYSLKGNLDELFSVKAEVYSSERGTISPVSRMSRGMRCIYMLSLLETYGGHQLQMHYCGKVPSCFCTQSFREDSWRDPVPSLEEEQVILPISPSFF